MIISKRTALSAQFKGTTLFDCLIARYYNCVVWLSVTEDSKTLSLGFFVAQRTVSIDCMMLYSIGVDLVCFRSLSV